MAVTFTGQLAIIIIAMLKEMFFGLQAYLSVNPDILYFDLSGGQCFINVYCSGDWSVVDKSSWVAITPISGTGSGKIRVSVMAYPEQRLGSITLSSSNLSVTLQVSQVDISLLV